MKSIFVIIAGFLIVCSSFSNLQAQHNKTKWLDGSWTGVGFQPMALNHQAWQIYLDYDFENETIAINYPDFPCSGHWKLVKADKHKAEFIEYIDEGEDLCNSEGQIIVTLIDDRYITISYFLPKIMDGVIASATMEKVIKTQD
jgi:hypothetical protein